MWISGFESVLSLGGTVGDDTWHWLEMGLSSGCFLQGGSWLILFCVHTQPHFSSKSCPEGEEEEGGGRGRPGGEFPPRVARGRDSEERVSTKQPPEPLLDSPTQSAPHTLTSSMS